VAAARCRAPCILLPSLDVSGKLLLIAHTAVLICYNMPIQCIYTYLVYVQRSSWLQASVHLGLVTTRQSHVGATRLTAAFRRISMTYLMRSEVTFVIDAVKHDPGIYHTRLSRQRKQVTAPGSRTRHA
jgi:hypothetical protein